MRWSIIFPTHNRRECALANLERLRELEPPADEILVCADGCSDGTATAIREQYPEVRLIETAGVGSVAARDLLMRAATGDWVLSLDDDSYPL
ncbi:MAG: glycosyltransferase, partial [Verrucomicrobiia bacterium]